MVEKENKANEILKYLQTGKELSTMQGIELFKTTSIARYIQELRNQGIEINTDIRKNEKTGSSYGVYTLSSKELKEISTMLQNAKQCKSSGKVKDAENIKKNVLELVNSYIEN